MSRLVTIDGPEIQRIVFDRILPAIEGEKIEGVVVSLLTAAVLALKPNISIEELQDVVMDTSTHLLFHLEDMKPDVLH
jgi:hypothetical protein